ncbi:BON domain-containing protein [Solirubrobacter ginsenosidimutans]|uniref:BON domain-containing protein n=1 Tax=Solirubrobacter ginsenosidimutans TaxID=490573 RepID=A0A9X3MPG1_9ACTN|nr:BON domain-containing protein [Solirubrobacter ginsenosidimutans]MDA0159880.1 BON domain-containing protein [Solirubrobacter ginsenosidimutans]
MSDTEVQRAIMQALADNPHVHADEIAAQVNAGDVVLHGTVGSPLQRDEAATTAEAVPGVRHVDDQLRVRFMDSDRRADAATQAAVVDALTADPDLHTAFLDVATRGGTVTLRGVVENAELRGKAAAIAFSVPGVDEVHNRLESAR